MNRFFTGLASGVAIWLVGMAAGFGWNLFAGMPMDLTNMGMLLGLLALVAGVAIANRSDTAAEDA